MKKSQIVAFDLVISLIIFMVFIGAFISLYFLMQNRDIGNERDFELEYIYANLENNMAFHQAKYSDNMDFLSNYRVDLTKLNNFFTTFRSSTVDDMVIGSVDEAHGIGMSAAAYDSCIYITDNDGRSLAVGTTNAVGQLKSATGPISCNLKIASGQNPCDDYSQGISLLKPVLLDERDPLRNRIVQLNIVLCKV